MGPHARTESIIIAWSAYGLSTRCWQQSGVMMWRANYRQLQSVWESSDAGVVVKCSLGHTSLLLNRDITSVIYVGNKLFLSTTPHVILMKQMLMDGRCTYYFEVDYSTRILVWDCRGNNGFFHKRLLLLIVQVWSNINCRISRSTVAWSDAKVLDYRRIMLPSLFHTKQFIHAT